MMDQGELDVAIMAKPDPFEDRFHVRPLYEEPFCVAFAAGHRFEERNTVRVADMDGESYLSRLNCEYYDQLDDGLRSARARVNEVFRSEREGLDTGHGINGPGHLFRAGVPTNN
jgi:DNA-binding transcriptional LysR family regulator